MTFDEFMEKMLAAFPGATVEEDNGGQMVVYTGLRLAEGDEVVPYEPKDEDGGEEPKEE